jgi:hypothetical protein
MDFEHLTAPPKGKGRESHTDLMLSWNDVCVGVEAKYTEPHYPTVSTWLTSGTNPANREAVLAGWCDLIQARTEEKFSVEAVSDITYQMIHRIAAVCSLPQRHAHVVYQVFNPDDEKQQYYRSDLLKLRKVIGQTDAIKIWLSCVEMVPSDKYRKLLEQWSIDRKPCPSDVIDGLASGGLMAFTDSVFEQLTVE